MIIELQRPNGIFFDGSIRQLTFFPVNVTHSLPPLIMAPANRSMFFSLIYYSSFLNVYALHEQLPLFCWHVFFSIFSRAHGPPAFCSYHNTFDVGLYRRCFHSKCNPKSFLQIPNDST